MHSRPLLPDESKVVPISSTILLRLPGWRRIVISLLVIGLGLYSAQALQRIDQDLRVMYTEYTLAATDLAHVLADVMRYRTTIIRALEAPTQRDFERITASLPDQRVRILSAVNRFAAVGLRVSHGGRSESQDVQAVRVSLEAYFSAADQTLRLLRQIWRADSPQEAAELRNQAERHAADNAGVKLVEVTLALDRLLETVADVGKDLRGEGMGMVRITSMALLIGSFLVATLNLLINRPQMSPIPGQSTPFGPSTDPASAGRFAGAHGPLQDALSPEPSQQEKEEQSSSGPATA
jgi:hypothetical protein